MSENATKEPEIEEVGNAYIVGPDAPASQLDRLDKMSGEDAKRYESFVSMREAVVAFSKRMGTHADEDPIQKAHATRVVAARKRAHLQKSSGETREAPQTNADDDDNEAYGRQGVMDDVIIPPFDFVTLCQIFENSSALRQNIDALTTNVHGFGYRFEPILDFGSPEIANEIRDLLLRQNIESETEGMRDLFDLKDNQIEAATPSIDSVEETRKRWQAIATIEKGRLQCFFDFINPLTTFTKVREETGEASELLGNAAWEVLREDPSDVSSRMTQVYPVPFVNVRLLRSDRTPTMVKTTVRRDAVTFEEIEVERYFRRYIRMTGNVTTYYKEFGDPRTVSRRTGEYFNDVEELKSKEGAEARPANELFHWKVRSPVSAYGVPRWISALLSVLGSRAAEEVNFLYFDNKAIPPMVLMCSGGRVSEQAVERLETFFNERIKGRANFHKIMIIEGLPAVGTEMDPGAAIEHSGKLRLELKPLMDAQNQDALFQNYDANNIKKIGRVFRQPQLLTGETADMNRSTAEVAKAFAEEQVYQPARDDFDGVMDRHFLTNLRIHFWRFRTNAPVQRYPNDLIENMKKSLESGAITPNEARKFVNDAFNIELPYRSEDWGDLPPKLSLMAARQGNMASGESPDDEFLAEGEETEIEQRAADSVGGVGDVVAVGLTSEEDGHQHRYLVFREGGELVVLVRPGGDDGHNHSVSLDGRPIQGDDVEIMTTEEAGHSHEIEFTMPVSKRRARAHGFSAFLNMVRAEIEQEVEAAKDSFFGGGE